MVGGENKRDRWGVAGRFPQTRLPSLGVPLNRRGHPERGGGKGLNPPPSSPMPHSDRFVALVDRARQRITQTDADAVQAQLAEAGGRPDGFVLIDVREQDEWDRGHLPGAVHLARGVLERDVEGAVPDLDTPVVLYCGGGYRSALAAASLGEMGYTDVTSMDGGWRAWTVAGYPTETPNR